MRWDKRWAWEGKSTLSRIPRPNRQSQVSPKSPLNRNILPKAPPWPAAANPQHLPFSSAVSRCVLVWDAGGPFLSLRQLQYDGLVLVFGSQFPPGRQWGVGQVKPRGPKDLPTEGTSYSCRQTISRSPLGPPLLGFPPFLIYPPPGAPQSLLRQPFILFWGVLRSLNLETNRSPPRHIPRP